MKKMIAALALMTASLALTANEPSGHTPPASAPCYVGEKLISENMGIAICVFEFNGNPYAPLVQE